MARKSRRNKNVEAVSNQIIENCENLIDTGAYIRLSVENGGNETDETLVVQQMLVEKFIEEHSDLKLAGTYIDNGFSGTNFERPGSSKMTLGISPNFRRKSFCSASFRNIPSDPYSIINASMSAKS